MRLSTRRLAGHTDLINQLSISMISVTTASATHRGGGACSWYQQNRRRAICAHMMSWAWLFWMTFYVGA
jgi:hypothetical protein